MRTHPLFLLNPLALPTVILLLPLVATGWFWQRTVRAEAKERQVLWIVSRRWIRILLLCMVAAWWALWDVERIPRWAQSGLHLAGARVTGFFLFVGPPIAMTFLVQFLGYSLTRGFLGDRWTTRDLARLALWSTVSPVAAEMIAAAGFADLHGRQWLGLGWLGLSAALVAAGTLGLRLAEGLKFRGVKSGELYKRTIYLARQMRIPVKEVMMVPPGRGQLTNAYSLGSGRIAMTENYSKFLVGAQLDAVIGHELGHAKRRHGRKKLAAMACVYGGLVLGCVFLPHGLLPARSLFNVGVVFVPVLIHRWISRKFEFEADRAGVELTHNPQMTILALENLYLFTGVPDRSDWLTELFATHPSLVRRTRAIQRGMAARKGAVAS